MAMPSRTQKARGEMKLPRAFTPCYPVPVTRGRVGPIIYYRATPTPWWLYVPIEP